MKSIQQETTDANAESLVDYARRLARENVQAEPNLEEILLFPHDEEVRLVETDPTFLTSERVQPFYFGAAPEYDQPFPLAIALILPEEKGRLPLPDGWGDWSDAIRIWPEK